MSLGPSPATSTWISYGCLGFLWLGQQGSLPLGNAGCRPPPGFLMAGFFIGFPLGFPMGFPMGGPMVCPMGFLIGLPMGFSIGLPVGISYGISYGVSYI